MLTYCMDILRDHLYTNWIFITTPLLLALLMLFGVRTNLLLYGHYYVEEKKKKKEEVKNPSMNFLFTHFNLENL